MKATTKSACGTSFHGTTIRTTVNKLKFRLGEPHALGGDKTNYEWIMETESGDVFTAYDYKNYGGIAENEFVDFHIGGNSLSITEQAKNEILATCVLAETY